MRSMLQPAFRADYVRTLIPTFGEVATDMKAVLMQNMGQPVNVEVIVLGEAQSHVYIALSSRTCFVGSPST